MPVLDDKGRRAHFRIVWFLNIGPKLGAEVAIHQSNREPCPWADLLLAEPAPGRRNLKPNDVHHRETHTTPLASLSSGRTLRVIVHAGSKTSVVSGRGNELSEGGMSLTAGVELRLGDETEIEFAPPHSGAPIRIRGVVRNRSGYRYGMEFVAGDDQEQPAVQRLKTVLGVLASA